MIFHYTKDDNFNRIQTNKKLSLTKSTSSNDEYDTIYLINLLKENCKTIFSEIIDSKDFKSSFNVDGIDSFVDLIVFILEKTVEDIKYDDSINAKNRKCFVICFTSRTDSRFLWETYAKDRGVNFGIDLLKYEKYIKENYRDLTHKTVEMKFEKVVYKPEEQIARLKKISKKVFINNYKNTEELSNVYQYFRTVLNLTDETDNIIHEAKLAPVMITIKQWIFNFISEYINELLMIAPFFKHPFWKEEEETRLCIFRPQFNSELSILNSFKREVIKDGSCMIEKVDYIEIPFPNDLIEKITIGPLSKYAKSYKVEDICINTKIKISVGYGIKRY